MLLGTDGPLKMVIVGCRWHQNARTDTLSVDFATNTHVSCRFPLLFTVTWLVRLSTRTQGILFQATHARVTFPAVFTLEQNRRQFCVGNHRASRAVWFGARTMKTAVLCDLFLSRDVPLIYLISQHLVYTAGATGVLERRRWAPKTRRDAGNMPVVCLYFTPL